MTHAPDPRPDAAVAHPSTAPRTSADADALARALRDSPPSTDAATLAAWQARLMGDWRRSVARPRWRRALDLVLARGGMAARPTAVAGLPSGSQGRGGGWRRPAAAGLLGLALLLAWVGWQRQREAALEELMQPDVLSQMSVGEL